MGRTTDEAIRTAIDAMTVEVRQVNEANGWYDATRTVGDGLALLHSEVSEWLEAFRSWGLSDVTRSRCSHVTVDPDGFHWHDDEHGLCKPQGVGSEAADVLIRLLDECDRQGIDLAAEFLRKLAHNRTRGHRHGGQAL